MTSLVCETEISGADRTQIISDTRFHLKNVLVGSIVMGGKGELDSTFPIIHTVCRRSPQTPGTNVSICLRRDADLSQTVADHMETRLKMFIDLYPMK